MRRGKTYDRQRGFTLVEVLAALAITSVIIAGTATLIHQVAFNFDRGARSMDRAEALALASDRLAGDFSAARFVVWPDDHTAAFEGGPDKVSFLSAAGVGARLPGARAGGEELVTLTVEETDGVTRLVRRRAAWPGPHVHFGDLDPGDSVVLVEGKVRVAPLRNQGLARLLPQLGGEDLTAGEALSATTGSPKVLVATADVQQATSWNSGQVIFRDDSLASAVDELNRYSDSRLLVTDPRVAALKVSGVFRTDRPQNFVAAITTFYPIKAVSVAPGVTRLTWREEGGAPHS